MTNIVMTFCSDEGVKIPHYTYYSLLALRHYNPESEIHFLSRPNHGFDKVFKDLNIKWVDYSDLTTENLEKFRATCDLKKHGTPNTKYPSPPNFFYGAMERLFVMEAYQESCGIKRFFHLENDVLIYYPIRNWNIEYMNFITCIPLTEKSATLAFCIIYYDSLKKLNQSILKYIEMGELEFCKKYQVDMFNEMTALTVFKSEKMQEMSFLVTKPIYEGNYVFDPGSYGQYLAGTNNEHGPGWAGDHHIIGREINSGNISVYMENGKPFVKTKEGDIHPIFNLHIHSKNLKDFIDVQN